MRISLIFSAVITVILSNMAHANPSEILNKAIYEYNRLDGQSQSSRLDIYERVVDNLEEILGEYPGSEEARIILTQQSIGDFNPSNVRNEYIAELTDYYNNVCEVSPSYTCLAYVSLNNGNNFCQNAEYYSDFDKAFHQLRNALDVFTSQNSAGGMVDLVVNTARQCTAGYELSDWNTDYYNSILVEMLIDVGLDDNARALIQDMTSPFFKFSGVLHLKEASGQLADADYLARLETFITDNISNQDAWNAPENQNAFLATLSLRMFAIEHSDVPIDYSYAYDAIQKYRLYGDTRNCDPEYANFLFNSMLDFQAALASVPNERREFTSGQLPVLLEGSAVRPDGVYSACEGQFENYSLAANIHGIIILEKGVKAAGDFRRLISQRALSSEELFIELVERIDPEEENLIDDYMSDGKYSGPTFAMLPIFKRLVDFGNVCESSAILFQNIAYTDRFEEAVEYMLQSPNIDASTNYSCGDEDLELMLK